MQNKWKDNLNVNSNSTAGNNVNNLNLTNVNTSAQQTLKAFRELQTTVLLVNNVSRNLTKKHLEEIFSFYGPLKAVFIPKDEDNKVSKSYAYLEYLKREDAEKACDFMGEGQIDGLKIRVTILNPPLEEEKVEHEQETTSVGNENFSGLGNTGSSNFYNSANVNKSSTQIGANESNYSSKYYQKRRSRSRSRKRNHYDRRRYNNKSRSRSRSYKRNYNKRRENVSSRSSSSKKSNKSNN